MVQLWQMTCHSGSWLAMMATDLSSWQMTYHNGSWLAITAANLPSRQLTCHDGSWPAITTADLPSQQLTCHHGATDLSSWQPTCCYGSWLFIFIFLLINFWADPWSYFTKTWFRIAGSKGNITVSETWHILQNNLKQWMYLFSVRWNGGENVQNIHYRSCKDVLSCSNVRDRKTIQQLFLWLILSSCAVVFLEVWHIVEYLLLYKSISPSYQVHGILKMQIIRLSNAISSVD